MSEREAIQEVSTQKGYAYWATSYDQENNALIAHCGKYRKATFRLNCFTDMRNNCLA